MLRRIVKDAQVRELKQMLIDAQNIVITCHVSPDGDAVGSSLCLLHLLHKLGKEVHIVTPDMIPSSLTFLPGLKDVVVFTRQELMAKHFMESADLIVCLDFNALYRVDRLSPLLKAAKAKKVLIDHHLEPENFADLVISYPKMSSTCELLFRLIHSMGFMKYMSKWSATCIYTGMMTDTGNFSYNSNDSDIYIAISQLLQRGIDKDEIYKIVCNTSTISKLKLNSYAISEKMEILDGGVAIITLTRSELNRYSYQKGDTEGLVNQPLGIEGVNVSIFFREESDYVKVSLRSVGDYAVNIIASELYNGGGHKNASGGEFFGTIEEAVTLIKSQINKYI